MASCYITGNVVDLLDMDYAKRIAELKEKINGTEPDVTKSELYHREVRNELALKREQVQQLKKEVQGANSKIFETSRELEMNKSLLKESEFNLKLALKKSATLENHLKEITASYNSLKLKEELKLSEIQILNDNNKKITRENHNLAREIDELRDQLKYTRAFQEELEIRQMKINAAILKTKEDNKKLEKEQLLMSELEKKMQTLDEFKTLNQLLINEKEKLKKENIELENALIENSTKYKKLSGLMEAQKYADPHQINIIAKIKFLQWENHYKKLQEKNINNETIISTLTTTLHDEIESNASLLLQNEELEYRIQELEKKLNVVKIKEEDNVIEVE